MTANILVGTASWTDKSLIQCGRFYPKGLDAEGRLRYYASQFPIVEVDSPYYAMPSAKNSELWAERTPPGFTFNLKVFRAMTQHQTPLDAFPPDIRKDLPATKKNLYAKDLPADVVDEIWRRYVGAIMPIADAGKLGAIHFQFPPWFTAGSASFRYLEEVRERLPRFTVAVEFRNLTWFSDATAAKQTLDFLRRHRFVNVIVDEPQGSKTAIPQVWEATSDERAILRLHGRNVATWNAKGLDAASDRFNWDYSETELSGFVSPAEDIARQVKVMDAIFNNNYEDQGQRNARTLMRLLGSHAVEPEQDLG